MHLHMLMLYDMLFRNWECPLQNIVFSNFWKENRNYRVLCDNK